MKRLLLLVFLVFVYLKCIAPTIGACIYIEKTKPLYPYNITDPQLRVVVFYESRFDQYAVNPVSKARGILQILPPMIKEVNSICKRQRLKERFTWDDAFDPVKSIRIWYIVQNYRNPKYDLAETCKIWFGTGKQYDGMTWREYYRDVNLLLSQIDKD